MGKREMLEVAARAAREATAKERGRCLWCIDSVTSQIADQADDKLVLSEGDAHVRETKLRLMRALAFQVRKAIAAGLEPTSHDTVDRDG